MKEIKFRAWDKKNKKMYYNYETHAYFSDQLHNKELEIMQFTGLKDKNGNSIYEGDIVKEGKFDDVGDNNKKKDILYIIEWNQDSLRYGWKQIIPVLTEGLKLEESEVVGNIYENPDLLTLPKAYTKGKGT